MLAIPLASIVYYALTQGLDLSTWQHVTIHLLPKYFSTTLLLALSVLAIAITTGAGTAWLIASFNFPGRKIFALTLILPMAVPTYLAAYAYVDFFQVTGPFAATLQKNFGADLSHYPNVRNGIVASLVMASVLFPYVFLACLAALKRESQSLFDAARTLGCSEVKVLTRVVLPMLRPAITVGGIFVVFEVLNDYGAVEHFALDTFATGLYRAWFGYGDKTFANQLAVIFLLFAVSLIVIDYRLRGRARFAPQRAQNYSRRRTLTGWKGLTAFVACALPCVTGFLGPFLMLLRHALSAPALFFDINLIAMVYRSFILGAFVAALSLVIGCIIAWTLRPGLQSTSRRTGRLVKTLATLGYSVPGALIAIGVMQVVPLAYGFLPLLVYAHTVRFSGIAVRNIEAGMEQISPTMEAAARTLGASPLITFRRLHLPMLLPAFAASLILIFVDAVKELPATVILRPFDFEVLPVHIHNLASDERLDAAAPYGLILVAVCIVPVFLMHRRLLREEKGRAN